MSIKYDFEIVPVFPSIIATVHVSEDMSTLWNEIENLDFFQSNTEEDAHLTYSTKNMQILDTLPDVKKIMLDYFYKFKNDTLKLQNTDFNITTSWMTKTETGGFCQYHCHKNSYYSAVLYKNDNIDGSGNLVITDDGIKGESILVNDPTELNVLTSKRIVIQPEKNLLVFFPSILRHRISKYSGKDARYSLAFNLFPTGKIGIGDSSVNFKI
jgi:uncharacterized protein (TIGR02466 family)